MYVRGVLCEFFIYSLFTPCLLFDADAAAVAVAVFAVFILFEFSLILLKKITRLLTWCSIQWWRYIMTMTTMGGLKFSFIFIHTIVHWHLLHTLTSTHIHGKNAHLSDTYTFLLLFFIFLFVPFNFPFNIRLKKREEKKHPAELMTGKRSISS